MINCTINGKSATLNLSNKQLQALLTGKFGDGAYEISNILNKYPVDCYNYKVWSSETILNWSKMQEYLKSTDNLNCSTRKKAVILKKIEQGKL